MKDQLIVVERISQAIEMGFVVDIETGEIIPVYDHENGGMVKGYKRDARRVAKQRKKLQELESWRLKRGIKNLEDVRNANDLEALLGDYSFYTPSHGLIGPWMVAATTNLSGKAKDLLHLLVAKKLQSQNYCVVSNDEVRELINDQSGNYNSYLKQLYEIGLIQIKRLSKTDKLLKINPLCGFRGSDGLREAAVRQWYKPGHCREIYENESLKAA